MPHVKFTVQSPAMMPPTGGGGPIPDPRPFYHGPQPDGVPNYVPSIQDAIVTGGTQHGKKWMGCTYISAGYVIPGTGTVEIFDGGPESMTF